MNDKNELTYEMKEEERKEKNINDIIDEDDEDGIQPLVPVRSTTSKNLAKGEYNIGHEMFQNTNADLQIYSPVAGNIELNCMLFIYFLFLFFYNSCVMWCHGIALCHFFVLRENKKATEKNINCCNREFAVAWK